MHVSGSCPARASSPPGSSQFSPTELMDPVETMDFAAQLESDGLAIAMLVVTGDGDEHRSDRWRESVVPAHR